MARRENPEINAGSMADIAFLLLIFFLVTTTMQVDSGIPMKLAQKPPKGWVPPVVKKKNLFEISINKNNELFVEGQTMEIAKLKDAALAFINNGGGTDKDGNRCDYCEGKKSESSSDHPSKAIIAIESDRDADYGVYVEVRDKLLSAYTDLRNDLSTKKYGKTFTEIETAYIEGSRSNKKLEEMVKSIKLAYPQIVTDIEPEGAN